MTATPLLVIGAGGHAKVLVGSLKRAGLVPHGLVDSDPGRHGARVLGVPVLGGDEIVDHYPPGTVKLVNGLGSVRRPELRAAIFQRFRDLGYEFAQVVDPAAVVGEEVTLGRGVQVMAGAVVQPGACLGDNCIVNTGACVDHDVVLGAHCHIAPGAVLSGDVVAGDKVHVGTGAVIRQGVRLGDGVVVAAGAVVISDVDAMTLVLGIPARPSAQ